MVEKLKRLGSLSLDIAWVALILLLPITSLPILSRLAGGTMVAPASVIPLGWLVLFWFVFYLVKRGTIPRESLPFLFFVCVALVASGAAFFLYLPPAKGQGISGEEISAILTLAIGAGFYLVAAGWLCGSRERVKLTFKLVNVSGSILLLWALVQAVYIYFLHGNYPDILQRFQQFISVNGLFHTRTTGFAFEPSWLAQQLNLIFLPFWLASTLTGWSAFRLRLWKISVENILLVIGVGVLFISSRVGTLSILLVAAFLGLYFNIYAARGLQTWSSARLARQPAFFQKTARALLPVAIILAFLGIYFLVAVGLVYVLSHVDPRLAAFFQITSLKQLKDISVSIYTILNYLQFAERYVYWVAGWNIFNLHPFLGVGLGNAGFFFQHALPAYSWQLPEVMENLYRSASLLNIKSFWMRLLAETGIIGFSAFITWYLVMIKSSWALRLSKVPLYKMIGWAGLFVLIAFIVEGFSTDTFALPYLWLSLGIVSAAAALVRKEAADLTAK